MKDYEIPELIGEWKVMLRPYRFGNYVNDHTVFCDNNGLWHIIGITSFAGKPNKEQYFLHATSAKLTGKFKEVAKVIDCGALAWAPCVIENNNKYYMFYGPSPTKLAVSNDSIEWFGYKTELSGEPPIACHRDHFVLKVDNIWYMYVSGVSDGKSAVSVLKSENLLSWQYIGNALSSGDASPLNPPWGAMESPYVVERNGKYYLFVTYTDCNKRNYNDTLVFVSDNPENFGVYNGNSDGAVPIANLTAHAGEVIRDIDGKYYITTCGWRRQSIGRGKVLLKELIWK